MKDYLFAIFGFIVSTIMVIFGTVMIYEEFLKLMALPWQVLMIVLPMIVMLYIAYFVGLIMACCFIVVAIRDWIKGKNEKIKGKNENSN